MTITVKRFVSALGLAALAALALPLGAQTTASIMGTVTDESGALVAGAAVRAINTQTNEARNSRTDDSGYYRFAELGVGVYSVQVELEGFKTALREGIELSLNRNARVDIQLALGSLAEKVSVVADAPLVEATTNEMGTLVNQRRVEDLPLNGRNTLSLIGLIPGAQNLQTGNSQGFIENKVSINGAREEDSNWTLDGGDNTSTLRNYGNAVPNPDAVQEFRVVTSNYSAEYGRTVGAVVNVITKGGTNELHGSLFHFLRNRRLNARNFFEPDTTPLVQNQFGGSAGGRIIRDKTFFFGSYQDFRVRLSDFRNSATVPTEAERSGDYSRTLFKGRPVTVKDPLSGLLFPNAIIPNSRLSPAALNYLKAAVPLPNDPGRGPNALTQRAGHPTDTVQYLGKIDHILTSSHKLSGAYFMSDSVDSQHFLGDTDFAWRSIQSRQHNLNIHEYWTIGPTMLNHFRATYTRSAGDRKIMPDDLTMLDLGVASWNPLPDGPKMPPDFEVVGWFDNGTANGGPKYANHYTLADTFDWVRGRHELKFGIEGWLQRMTDVSTAPRMGGSFVFDGSVSGNSMPDLLLGQARSLDVGAQSYKSQSSWVANWFVQDKVRVNRKLVLNVGLRHELSTWPVHPLDALIAIRLGQKSTCVPSAPTGLVFPCDAGIPRAGVRSDYNNFAPRFGLAYDLFGDGRTVIRTGYGISYAFNYFNALQEQQVSVPFQYRANITTGTTLADPYAPIKGNPFPFRSDPQHLVITSSGSYGFQDFDMRTGYTQQYNFSIQRQIGADWSFEAAYLGNVARKLMGQIDFNAPFRTANATKSNIDQRRPLYPNFRDMRMTGGFVNASYNALQLRAERRFAHGFTLLGSYSFSKALDESSWYSSRNEWADTYNRWLNKSRGENDRAHVLTLSWVWETPRYEGSLRAAKAVLNGWSVNGIASFYSGGPVLVNVNKDNDFDGNSSGDRPDVTSDWKLSPNRARGEAVAAWFNTRAFVENKAGQLGTLGRNVVTGPGFKNVDIGIGRTFNVTEKYRLQFKAEGFNLCNWVNLQDPEGRVTQALFGQITTARDPRIVQFGLKLAF